MTLITDGLSFVLNLDENLTLMIHHFGLWTYAFLFLLILIETGFIIFPFLPGNSLLFATGALAAANGLNILLVMCTFFMANTLGATLNYAFGLKIGLTPAEGSLFKKVLGSKKIQQAETYFNDHGGKTIFLARLLPFIWTVTPFLAGASNMRFRNFLLFNLAGGLIWVSICCLAGFFLGSMPLFKQHFSLVLMSVTLLSILPIIFAQIKKHYKAAS